MQTNSTKELLAEVRKSYRLLYSYQKRILDLVDFIGKKYGLNYDGGYPKFSSPGPRNGSGRLDLWAWDWLNMYFYEFHFQNKKAGEDTIYFSIFLMNDSGFFETHNENKIGKTSVSKFAEVEDSTSDLIFVVGKNLWDGWGYNWDEPEFILNESGEKRKGNNKYMIFKHYALDLFEDENGAMKCIKDFEALCKENNIKLKVLDQKI
ncbi:hypothetical protein C8N47_12733 [Mangrovibacterium marinum]|uniref:Uncharacterized protein n=1 Tax=Mangrovibacterium marinum TaxID=1639118 RepID=A0A2T5BXM0_9BACT|nr:hypothetical protein [Mangrovibacterium marinum]PTN05311.1 hypothetical protein C8N47_12733 [Mangrovibacterium marinum]